MDKIKLSKQHNQKRDYKFSLIMAVYNTENYLEEALLSVINQNIGFEDNVQLIIVNDGSTDKSKDIILKYRDKYPENIIYLEQENQGSATARNNAMHYITGQYVNFLDSDDTFEENALKEVYSFFTKHENEIDVISIPITFFGRKDNNHMLDNKFKKTRVVDLEKEPNNPQLSGASSFFKSEIFKQYKFPTDVFSAEDTILLTKIILRKKKYGLLNTTRYNYRKRFDFSSTIDSTIKADKKFFITQLKNYFLYLIDYSKEKEGKVIDYVQYLLAYDLQWILKKSELPQFNDNELSEFKSLLKEVLKSIDVRCIRDNEYINYNIFKSFFMYLKNDDFHKEIDEDNVTIRTNNYSIDSLKNHNIWLDIVEIKDDTLFISGFLNSHFSKNSISIYAIKENNKGITAQYGAKEVKYTSRQNVRFLSRDWQYKYSFDIKIPLSTEETSQITIKTNYHMDEDNNNLDEDNLISLFLNVNLTKHVKLSEISNYIVKDDYLLFFEDNTFTIEKYTYNKLKIYESIVQNHIINCKNHNYVQALELRRRYIENYPRIRFYKKFFRTYLFVDRIESADDNAEHLFRYATRKMDGVKKYFVVSSQSKDFERLSKYGKVVDFNSEEHKFLYLLADKVITTHPYESGINPFFSYDKSLDERDNYAGLVTPQIYFLQHGVTKDNISDWMSKFDKNLSLLVTVNDDEKESFNVEGYGYDKNIIQTLGFPRYDNLKNNDNKQILIIPTWRKYLRGNKKLFMNSDYFKRINDLLNNQEFIEYAKKKGYSIIFKAHPEVEKNINDTEERYIDLFDMDESVKLSRGESYQELLNNSSLLITDYSSVFYDFAYMKKPIIYYHPGDDYHYEEGYFDYETMGFGEIVENEKELIDSIKEYIDSGCIMKDKYVERVNGFFKFTDKNNSKRVYNWIKKH